VSLPRLDTHYRPTPQPDEPGAALGPISAILPHVDTVVVNLARPAPHAMLDAIRAAAGRHNGRERAHNFRTSGGPDDLRRLTLQQPTPEAFGLVAALPHAVSWLHIAYELVCADWESAIAVASFLDRHAVQPWRGRRKANMIGGTVYAATKADAARNFCLYLRRSKFTGAPCIRFEIRLHGEAACRRVGVTDVGDIPKINPRRLLLKNLRMLYIPQERRDALGDEIERHVEAEARRRHDQAWGYLRRCQRRGDPQADLPKVPNLADCVRNIRSRHHESLDALGLPLPDHWADAPAFWLKDFFPRILHRHARAIAPNRLLAMMGSTLIKGQRCIAPCDYRHIPAHRHVYSDQGLTRVLGPRQGPSRRRVYCPPLVECYGAPGPVARSVAPSAERPAKHALIEPRNWQVDATGRSIRAKSASDPTALERALARVAVVASSKRGGKIDRVVMPDLQTKVSRHVGRRPASPACLVRQSRL